MGERRVAAYGLDGLDIGVVREDQSALAQQPSSLAWPLSGRRYPRCTHWPIVQHSGLPHTSGVPIGQLATLTGETVKAVRYWTGRTRTH